MMGMDVQRFNRKRNGGRFERAGGMTSANASVIRATNNSKATRLLNTEGVPRVPLAYVIILACVGTFGMSCCRVHRIFGPLLPPVASLETRFSFRRTPHL